jgi:hypothetical protein
MMSPRLRLLALVGAAAALWFARDALLPTGVAEADGSRPRTALRGAAPRAVTLASGEICTVPSVLPERGRFDAAFAKNPFALPQVAAKALPPAPVVAAFVGPPLPPPPPQLPYRYLGALNEKGQVASVFLMLGDKLIIAKAGDTIDGGYRLEGIAPRELTFLNLQQNLTVRMPVDGESL